MNQLNPLNPLQGMERFLDPTVLAREAGAGLRNVETARMREARDSARISKVFDAAARYGTETFSTRLHQTDRLRSDRLRLNVMDAAVAGGMAFLESELEKRDPKVHEPLTSVTWMRDMTVKSGGGWVDFTSNLFVDYGISGPNGFGLQGGQTTTIPIVQANLTKDLYPTFNWGNVLKVNFIDLQKLQGVGRSLDDMLDKGIKLNWNKTLDQLTYTGPYGTSAFPGLINSGAISASSVATGASGLKTWINKTPAEILFDVNTAMVSTWAASQYDVTGMADSILIPPAQFAYIASQLISSAGACSILTYLLENNIGKTQGVDLKIFPSRWCIAAGAGATDRMVCYVNNDDKVYMDVTVPIQRVMTTPNIDEGGGAYLTLYQGQLGMVKFMYTTPALYQDGI